MQDQEREFKFCKYAASFRLLGSKCFWPTAASEANLNLSSWELGRISLNFGRTIFQDFTSCPSNFTDGGTSLPQISLRLELARDPCKIFGGVDPDLCEKLRKLNSWSAPQKFSEFMAQSRKRS